jgi:hypothetical protein
LCIIGINEDGIPKTGAGSLYELLPDDESETAPSRFPKTKSADWNSGEIDIQGDVFRLSISCSTFLDSIISPTKISFTPFPDDPVDCKNRKRKGTKTNSQFLPGRIVPDLLSRV